MIRRFLPFLLATFAMTWLANLTSQAQQASLPQSSELDAWRKTIKETPLPDKGCFKASFPATTWRTVTCTTAPVRPYGPARGARSLTVGNGTDYSGLVSGHLSKAEGTFPTVSNVTSISSTYSLQLNANTFTTSVCSGAANPSTCSGWQQFVYSESPSTVFMQYWLLNWGKACPSGWNEDTVGGETDCFKNSSAASVTAQGINNLGSIALVGEASGGTDTVLMDTPNGDVDAVGADTVLNLESGWNAAEFNIFGNCCASEVSFNADATLVGQVSLTNGTTTKPTCESVGFTGETNNLTLAKPCCPYSGTTPMIQFAESNDGTTASCGASAIQITIPLACVATPSCSVQGSGPGEVVAGQVVLSCTHSTLLTASATICGNTCVTDSVAPPQPTSGLGAGDATPGTGGSCSLSWSWGGNSFGQTLDVN